MFGGIESYSNIFSSSITVLSLFSDDIWFLAPLYSLCRSYSKGHWKQLNTIFSSGNDIIDDTIAMKIWRFGEWQEIQVETTLSSRDGKLIYVQSRQKDIFWSSLLQKVIAM